MKKLVMMGLLLANLLFNAACDNSSNFPAAPVNDEPALQKLADAYTQVREGLSVSPTGLNAQGKRKFVEKVFEKAGFSYHKTILAVAAIPEKKRSQHLKDLKQLILMPASRLNKKHFSEVFSPEEITAINKMGD